MTNRLIRTLFLSLVGLAPFSAMSQPSRTPAPKLVVFITIDAMRADYLRDSITSSQVGSGDCTGGELYSRMDFRTMR
jgi:hypothetical protein